jgi:hypothetical protein
VRRVQGGAVGAVGAAQARPDSSHGSVAGWLAGGLAASVVVGGGSATVQRP